MSLNDMYVYCFFFFLEGWLIWVSCWCDVICCDDNHNHDEYREGVPFTSNLLDAMIPHSPLIDLSHLRFLRRSEWKRVW